jgi:peptide/nickel transport system permease protein
MLRYLVTRGVSMVPVLFFLTLGTFLMLRLTPGDPVTLMLGENADPVTVAQIRQDLGLDEPLPVQYVRWTAQVLQGDLGRSIRTHEPVLRSIFDRLPVTLELSGLALLVALAIGVPTGVISATRPGTWLDRIVSVAAFAGAAVPTFFLGLLLILFFGLRLGWFPTSGFVPLGRDPVLNLRLLVLPSITLGVGVAAVIARLTRSSMLEILGREYVVTARGKGLAEAVVIRRHVLRNALLPVVTIVGLQVGALLGGAVVTEVIFAIPGVGRLLVANIFAHDFPVVQGVVLFLGIVRLAANLLTDLTYAYIDPRITFS